MKALFDSLVRTYVPWLAGIIIGWLISLGVPLDPEVEVQVTLALMGAASLIWYFLGRVFELYVHPKLGWLLGLPKQPIYDEQGASGSDVTIHNPVARDLMREAYDRAEIGGIGIETDSAGRTKMNRLPGHQIADDPLKD